MPITRPGWSSAQLTRRAYHVVERVQESVCLCLVVCFGVRQLQEPRAQHRRQGEADEHGHEDGEGHRPAERVDEALRVPVHERDRHEDDDERQRRRHHGKGDLARALDGCLEGSAPFLFDVPEDVLEHDDRIVDDDPDRERDREQRHVVQRGAHHVHQRERRDDGGRDRQRGDEDGPDVADEHHDDDGGEEAAEQQVLLERRDGRVDEPGVVARQRDGHVLRQRAPDRLQPPANALGHRDRVLAHRPADIEHDGGVLAQPGGGGRALETVFRVPHVGHADRRPVHRGDRDAPEVASRVEPAERPQQELPLPLLDDAPGDLDVLRGDGVADLCHRQPVRVQLLEIDHDVNLARTPAADRDVADAVDRLDDPRDLLVRELGQSPQAHDLRRHHDRHDGRGVGIDLCDDRRQELGRHASDRARDFLPDVVDRFADLALQDEAHGNVGPTLGHARRHLVDPGHAADGVLHRLDRGGRDLGGTGAGEGQAHVDRRRIRSGKQVDAQIPEREDAEDHQRHDEHRREHRTADAEFRQHAA